MGTVTALKAQNTALAKFNSDKDLGTKIEELESEVKASDDKVLTDLGYVTEYVKKQLADAKAASALAGTYSQTATNVTSMSDIDSAKSAESSAKNQ